MSVASLSILELTRRPGMNAPADSASKRAGRVRLVEQARGSASLDRGTVVNISAGSPEKPIRGSGVFVAGYGEDEARSCPRRCKRERSTPTAGSSPAQPVSFPCGVFVVSGAVVEEVVNDGPVTTYVANDMVLDNWGRAPSWKANQPIVSWSERDRLRELRRDRLPPRPRADRDSQAGSSGFQQLRRLTDPRSLKSIRTNGARS
jgi:hypothetical protein